VPPTIGAAVTSAALLPEPMSSCVPSGAYSRSVGSIGSGSKMFPTRTANASPAFAVTVQTSRSPTSTVPLCMNPLVSAPSSPGVTTTDTPVRTSVKR
jgi:hypothetical protein